MCTDRGTLPLRKGYMFFGWVSDYSYLDISRVLVGIFWYVY